MTKFFTSILVEQQLQTSHYDNLEMDIILILCKLIHSFDFNTKIEYGSNIYVTIDPSQLTRHN